MHRNRFSLASLLLLTAVVAIYFAAVGTARMSHSEIDSRFMLVCGIAGLVVGGVVGTVVALTRRRSAAGIAIGLIAGTAIGAAGGVLMALPNTFWAIAVGSLVLLLFAAAMRFCSTRPKGHFLVGGVSDGD